MATFTAIPEKAQNATAMKRVIDYVMQDKKTIYDGIKLVGGQNCVPESAYQEFMATKHQYSKANGVFFKQYVQSFKPNCGVTPQLIHQIGLETAKAFEGYEVLVATHIDRDHWHNHFVVNSVSCETGLKIQINEKGLEELRHKSDEICQQFGLEILAPYQKPKQRSLNQQEYRAALRGNSKKLKLTNAIDYAVAMSRNKQQFTDQMQKLGYGVKWIDHYKYITYTTPDGQRFRDNRLLEDKYLKKNMEELFAYEYSTVKTNQSNTSHNRTDGISLDRADTTAISDAQAGAVQSVGGEHLNDWERHCREHGFDIRIADASGLERFSSTSAPTVCSGNERNSSGQNGLDTVFRRGQIVEADGYIEKVNPIGAAEYDDGVEGERFDSEDAEIQMDADWRDIAVNTAYLAADLQMMFGGTDDRKPQKKKTVRERKHEQKKKEDQSQNNDFELKM